MARQRTSVPLYPIGSDIRGNRRFWIGIEDSERTTFVRLSRRLNLLAMSIVSALFILSASGVAALQSQSTPTANGEQAIPSLIFQPVSTTNVPYFDITLDAGASTSLMVALANGGRQPVDIRTYAADGYTIQNGGFGLRDARAKRSGVTLWVDYSEQNISLKPGEKVDRAFSVSVPPGTAPGQYMTGLAMETAKPLKMSGQGEFQFNQILRKVLAIRITVPGPKQPSFSVSDPSLAQKSSGQAITATIANTGNVLVKPAGEVQIVDQRGKHVLSAPVQMGPIYAHDTTTLFIPLAQPLPAGNYTMSVDLKDQATGAKAGVNDAKVAVTSGAAPQSPLTFSSAAAMPKPSADKIQFLDIAATIHNTGEPVTNARVMLNVEKDGKKVEDFALASSLALPQGDTPVQNRYIPADGWSKGTWTFTLTLEVVDPNTGAARVLTTAELGNPVAVP